MRGIRVQISLTKDQYEDLKRTTVEYRYTDIQEFIKEAIRQHIEDISSTTEKWRRIHHDRKPQGGR